MINDLYKAKELKDETWVEGQLLVTNLGSRIIVDWDVIHDVIEQYGVDEGTLCRWTRHEDKNGNKIFRNDICMYNGNDSPVVVEYGEYYNKDCDCTIEGWYYVSKGQPQVFRFTSSDIEVIGNVYGESILQVGSIVYILDTLTLDGSVKVEEARVSETDNNGKLVVQAVGRETRWILNQSFLNRMVFHTLEEAKEAEEAEKASREQ